MKFFRNVFSRKRWRFVQLALGVHRIHHIRWGFGWKLPFLRIARFQAFTTKDQWNNDAPKVVAYGWKKITPKSFHDCTWTGRY